MKEVLETACALPQYLIEEYLEFPPGVDGTPAVLANSETQQEFDRSYPPETRRVASATSTRHTLYLHEVARENLEHQTLFYMDQQKAGALNMTRAMQFYQSVSSTLAGYSPDNQLWVQTHVLRPLEEILDTRTGA